MRVWATQSSWGCLCSLQRGSLPAHTVLWLCDCMWPTDLVWNLVLFLALQQGHEGETIHSLVTAPLTQRYSSSVFGVYFDRLATRHTWNVSQGLGRTILSHHWAGLVRVTSPAQCQHTSWLSPSRAVAASGWGCAQSNQICLWRRIRSLGQLTGQCNYTSSGANSGTTASGWIV